MSKACCLTDIAWGQQGQVRAHRAGATGITCLSHQRPVAATVLPSLLYLAAFRLILSQVCLLVLHSHTTHSGKPNTTYNHVSYN